MDKALHIFERIRARPVLSLAKGWVFILLGLLVSDVPRMIMSLWWPTTDGIIVSNRLVGQRFEEYDGDVYSHFDAYIRYEYHVEGVSYSSLSVNAIDAPYSPADTAPRYPVGREVVVYFNPNNPSDAVLEPGIADLPRAFNIFSDFFFVTAIYFLFVGILGIKREIATRFSDSG